MSEFSNDATVSTDTGAANNNTEDHDSLSPPYLMVSNGLQSSFDASSPNDEITDKEKDLIAPRNEKLSKESKKQAMGDIVSNDGDLMKCITESIATKSTVSQTENDNTIKNQKQSKGTKMDTKISETKKVQTQTTRLLTDSRHRNDAFHVGGGKRCSINCGSRSTIYTSREYWRPHSTGGHSGSSLRRSTPITINDQTSSDNAATVAAVAEVAGTRTVTDKAGNANAHTTTTASLKNANSHGNKFTVRSQVIRTFRNGAFRVNRTWRNNTVPRSRSRTVTSELSSQSLTENAADTDSLPYLNNNTVASQIAETYHSVKNEIFNQRNGKFPIIYVTPTGTISILLHKGITIEIAVDRAIRVICHDKFSTVCNGRGNSSCILHKKARVFQQDEKVFCNFGSSSNEKAAVFGTQGVLFTMSHLSEAYLVSSTIVKGTLSVSLGRLQFPSLDYDFTVRMFFTDAQTGHQFTQLCKEIVQEARYVIRDNGTITLTINGVYIKQDERGNVEINCRPKHISCSPSDGVVHVRTNMVDMGVQENDKAFVKRGLKRIHVSRSGMVVSDGNCITSMDHFGHIVSST